MFKFSFSILLFVCSSVLYAESCPWELYEDECCIEEDPCYCRFKLHGDFEWIDSSKFKDVALAGQKIGFHQAEAKFSYVQPFSECHGVVLGLGFHRTYLNWSGNPHFNQKDFNDVLLSVDGYVDDIGCWDWKAGLEVLADVDHFSLTKDTRYHLYTWGRYALCNSCFPDLGIHIGAIALVGIKDESIYPVVGVDFSPWCDWKVNLIFPFDLSIHYEFMDHWSLVLAGKLWESRHRVGEHETVHHAMFDYENVGLELGIEYECADYIHANLHLGSTLHGRIKVEDEHGAQIADNKFRNALYVGGELSFCF